MKYDIYLSYKRRPVSRTAAAFIYEFLRGKGFSVFFDRQELRSGEYRKQIFNHIENATDIIVLLEDTSFDSISNDKKNNAFKSDWFCIEIMESLKYKDTKNIIPVLLNNCSMESFKKILPEELLGISILQDLKFDTSDINHFYEELIKKEFIKSKPGFRYGSSSDGGSVADFLFYSNSDCEIYEYGNLIATIDINVDEDHPFRYSVAHSGEHRFHIINSDTCREQNITINIDLTSQKYVYIVWEDGQKLWDLTPEIIKAENRPEVLFEWGSGLFHGTGKHDPCLSLSLKCLLKAVDLKFDKAKDFIKNRNFGLMKKTTPETAMEWYKHAAMFGSPEAMMKVAEDFLSKGNKKNAIHWIQKAAELGYSKAQVELGILYEEISDTESALKWYREAKKNQEDLRVDERIKILLDK